MGTLRPQGQLAPGMEPVYPPPRGTARIQTHPRWAHIQRHPEGLPAEALAWSLPPRPCPLRGEKELGGLAEPPVLEAPASLAPCGRHAWLGRLCTRHGSRWAPILAAGQELPQPECAFLQLFARKGPFCVVGAWGL